MIYKASAVNESDALEADMRCEKWPNEKQLFARNKNRHPVFPALLRASQVFRQNLVWTNKLPPTAQMVLLETLHPCWSYDTGGMLPWGWSVMSSSTAICWAPSRGSPGFGSQLLSHSWLPYCSTLEMIKAKWLLGRQAGQHQSCFTLTEHALTFRKSKRVELSQNTLGTSISHVGQNAQHCGKGINSPKNDNSVIIIPSCCFKLLCCFSLKHKNIIYCYC